MITLVNIQDGLHNNYNGTTLDRIEETLSLLKISTLIKMDLNEMIKFVQNAEDLREGLYRKYN